MQNRRRRDDRDYSEQQLPEDSEDDESYEIDQGPSPAEQYGLQVKRLSAGSNNQIMTQPRLSASLEKYKKMARNIKTGVANVSQSPIKEVSKIQAQGAEVNPPTHDSQMMKRARQSSNQYENSPSQVQQTTSDRSGVPSVPAASGGRRKSDIFSKGLSGIPKPPLAAQYETHNPRITISQVNTNQTTFSTAFNSRGGGVS
jgi:hypothetical protein